MAIFHSYVSLPEGIQQIYTGSSTNDQPLFGGFHKWGIPIAGWFITENPKIKWMILGYPHFRKPPFFNGYHLRWYWF